MCCVFVWRNLVRNIQSRGKLDLRNVRPASCLSLKPCTYARSILHIPTMFGVSSTFRTPILRVCSAGGLYTASTGRPVKHRRPGGEKAYGKRRNPSYPYTSSGGRGARGGLHSENGTIRQTTDVCLSIYDHNARMNPRDEQEGGGSMITTSRCTLQAIAAGRER